MAILKKNSVSFKASVDCMNNEDGELFFTYLNMRDKGKLFGKIDSYLLYKDNITAEDIFYSLDCDLFGSKFYKINISIEELPDVQKTKRKKEKGKREKIKKESLRTQE